MLQIGFHLPLLRGGFCWLLSREAQIGGMLHLYLIFLKFLPAPHSISVAHSNWPSGSPSPLIARSSSSNCSFSLGGRPALGRVLVLPEFFFLSEVQYRGNCAHGRKISILQNLLSYLALQFHTILSFNSSDRS